MGPQPALASPLDPCALPRPLRLRDPQGNQGKVEEEAAELEAGDEPTSRSETAKWGRLTKPEFVSWLALGKAPATYSQWKAGSSTCPEAGQARPQKPLKQGFSSADITQVRPAEPPTP